MSSRILPLDGGPLFQYGRRVARSCRECPADGVFACDWILRPGVRCAAPLCEHHAESPAPDKHLCPRHVTAWEERQNGRRDRGS